VRYIDRGDEVREPAVVLGDGVRADEAIVSPQEASMARFSANPAPVVVDVDQHVGVVLRDRSGAVRGPVVDGDDLDRFGEALRPDGSEHGRDVSLWNRTMALTVGAMMLQRCVRSRPVAVADLRTG
jgi:hypothetical protein